MATSRDDFVIAIRSAFIKKSNKQRFSLIALILFSFFLIILTRIDFKPVNYLKVGLNEIERHTVSAAERTDFVPLDFMEKRGKR